MCLNNIDRISDLPGNITENILRYLPLKDAGKTSVLSKTWRYKWVTIPKLAFDDEFGKILPGKSKPARDKLVLNIFQVLLRHHGPLDAFVLSMPELESCPEIDQFILFVSGKDIQRLHIEIKSWKYHEMPSCLFSCLQLRFLHLASCIFKSPPKLYKGFSKLTILQFQSVNFIADINNFISESPLLEKLMIQNCSDFYHLQIDAPNLKYFYFEGILHSISFKNTALLENVTMNAIKDSFSLSKKGRTSNFINVFSCLPAIKLLYASHILFKFLAIGGIPDIIPTTLKCLRVLKLDHICFHSVDETSCALCLIRSSPNVRELTIGINAAADKAPVIELLQAQDPTEYSLDRLEKVEFNNFCGTLSELELVKLLLATSSVLENMIIWPKDAISAKEVIKILKELTRFQRASPKAEVLYEDSHIIYPTQSAFQQRTSFVLYY